MSPPSKPDKYLVLDDNNRPLARAYLNEEISSGRKIFTYVDKRPPDLTTYPMVSIISLSSDTFIAWAGKVEQQRHNRFIFQPTAEASKSLRRNLRVDLRFTTYLYPIRPRSRPQNTRSEPAYPWLTPNKPKQPSRIAVSTLDISCGGIALISSYPLETGGVYSIVIPILHEPIILPLRVLRTKTIKIAEQEHTLYSCEFHDLLAYEEALLRETIFDYQLKHQNKS